MAEVSIDYDTGTNKLLVRAPIWMVDKCRGIPNRRWVKGKRAWSAPLLMRNIEYLQKTFREAEWSVGAQQRVDQLRDSRIIRRLGFPAWYKFKREPKVKAREALNQAYGMREFGFFMGVGGGKTQAFIDWASCLAMEGLVNASLVVVPNSVTHNWLDELQTVCPIEYKALVMDTGSYRKTTQFLGLSGSFRWLIMSWESLSQGKAWTYAEKFLLGSKCIMAGDESQNGKNFKATRTERWTQLMKLAQYRAAMTGTSVLKTLEDLYSQMEALDTNIIGIGDFYSYRNRYCVMGGYEDKEVVGYQNVDELMELIRPYVYVARTRECTDLPIKTPEDSPPGILRKVDLTPEQRELYKAVKAKDKIPMFKGRAVPVKNTLEVALRARQICQNIVSVDTGRKEKDGVTAILEQCYVSQRNPKIEELMRLVDELDDDLQVIVWTPFVLDVQAATSTLRDAFGPDCVLNLPKGDPAALQQCTREFRAGRYRFCVATQKQGGIGVNNLQSASVTIYLGNTDSFGDRMQSEGRMERTGQENPMFVYDIVAENSVDTKTILPSLRERKDVTEFVTRKLQAGSPFGDLV